MSNDFALYGYAALVVILFALRRMLRKGFKKYSLQPSLEVPEGDYRKRAFTDPIEAAPYFTLINGLQVALGLGMLYIGLNFRTWRVVLVITLVFYILSAYLLQRILYIQLFTFGHFTFVDPSPSGTVWCWRRDSF